jgi:hypothetical protein|tara:strand:+ start:146 stop:304 length:159 start_codon:yes stop_codon:yes gene_type:complete
MWKWLINLFKPKNQLDPHIEQFEDVDYSKLSKGDLKKLKAQGKIKSIYFPYN